MVRVKQSEAKAKVMVLRIKVKKEVFKGGHQEEEKRSLPEREEAEEGCSDNRKRREGGSPRRCGEDMETA
ncbi:hypothetical protein AXX17_AT4G06540 [Arabidopsis thaliana]|uniref:Uncharacterized protein n=1 Tax=Arabidopsis thaliana TaxID=3702 RepID=A0A178UYA7_ARATH|nr:hypothetical protein AXX17_AT4G06540 [Arabidopsis thaliana]